MTSPTRVEANSTTYQDSTGENPAAPDISTIVVSNNDARAITFRINIPNRATLTPDMLLLVFADTDANPATGDPDSLGADYVIQVFGGEAALFRWDGVDFTRRAGDPPATTLGFSYSGGVTIGISAAELGNTQRFGFAVIAVSGIVVDSSGNLDFTNAVSDVAPAAGAGLYVYDVRVATSPPPPPPPQPPPPTQPQGRTIEDAPRLPSRIRYVGNSIKHVRLGEKLYATMKRLGAPRVVAVACWSKADWPSVLNSIGDDPGDGIDGFWHPLQPRWLHLAPKQCTDVQGLMSDRQPNGQRAYALSTVLHERIHAQRIPMTRKEAEARTECYAVQLVYAFARELNFVETKALRLEQLAVRKSNAEFTGTKYRDPVRCRDGGAWDIYPEFRNLNY